MKLRVIGLTFAIVATAFGSALAVNSGTIGVFADADGNSCVINATPYVPTTFFILAKPTIANTNGGVNGAEFRITGAPSGADAVLTATPNPASNLNQGNPFDTGGLAPQGCNIAFPTCALPTASGVVLLYTVQLVVLNGVNVADTEFTVTARNPPTNPISANWLLINACDAPAFTAVEATGGKAYLNHASPGGCTTVAVEGKTWGQVKSIYN